MSTPAGQLLSVRDLKRIENLGTEKKKLKATKQEIAHFNKMKEEILQFMQLKKQKNSAEVNQSLERTVIGGSLSAVNDDQQCFSYSKQTTCLVD